MLNKTSGCSCESGEACCGASDPVSESTIVAIDFLYLDLSVCNRCQDTDANLEAALNDVSKLLQAAGRQVVLNKVCIDSEETATSYKFISSPTIRVNGRDIQMQTKESLCESCGDLCGEKVNCRVWEFDGEDYAAPPKAKLVEAILREVFSTETLYRQDIDYSLPENLRKFFRSRKE